MADFIPPIVVDIISNSAGFGKGVDKAKADMADLSTAASGAAGDTEAATVVFETLGRLFGTRAAGATVVDLATRRKGLPG